MDATTPGSGQEGVDAIVLTNAPYVADGLYAGSADVSPATSAMSQSEVEQCSVTRIEPTDRGEAKGCQETATPIRSKLETAELVSMTANVVSEEATSAEETKSPEAVYRASKEELTKSGEEMESSPMALVEPQFPKSPRSGDVCEQDKGRLAEENQRELTQPTLVASLSNGMTCEAKLSKVSVRLESEGMSEKEASK